MFSFSQDQTDASDVLKGIIAGLAGGAAGTWAMTRMQPRLQELAQQTFEEDQDENDNDDSGGDDESATAKAAVAVAGRAGVRLDRQQKEAAAQGVHYGFGTAMGGVYGGIAEVAPSVTSGMGLPAGLVLFLVADEVAVPAAGLSGPPTQMPASSHAYGLASHLVYGLVAEVVRRVVRALL